jgi:hypothetical protein
MKNYIALSDKIEFLANEQMESLMIYAVLTLPECPPLYVGGIQGLLPAQANPVYLLAWFQSLQLLSAQSKTSPALLPFLTKCHTPFGESTRVNRKQNFSSFMFGSRLTVSRLARVYCVCICNNT